VLDCVYQNFIPTRCTCSAETCARVPRVGLIERHDQDIVGVSSHYDRVIINGTLPGFGHSEGMNSYLSANGFRSFDCTKLAEPLRDQTRTNSERLARRNGFESQFLRKGNIHKEAVV
jgi:hypothetical protein